MNIIVGDTRQACVIKKIDMGFTDSECIFVTKKEDLKGRKFLEEDKVHFAWNHYLMDDEEEILDNIKLNTIRKG